MRGEKRRLLLSYEEHAELQRLKEEHCFPHGQHLLFFSVRTAYTRREDFYPFLLRVKNRSKTMLIETKGQTNVAMTAYLCDKDYEFLHRCAQLLGLKTTNARARGIIAYYAVLFALRGPDHASGG